jgi:hypothetical protein
LILGLLATAWGAPVVEEAGDPFARCLVEASAAVGPMPDPRALAHGPRIAVVAGVSCLRDDRLPPLRYAARDAARLAERLLAAGWQVVQLPPGASAADLRTAIDAASEAVDPGGTLLVYWSGHGLLRARGSQVERVLGTSDLVLGEPASGLTAGELEERVRGSWAGTRVLIFDTCFAAQPVGDLAETGFEADVPVTAGDVRLYAAANFERAEEDPALRASPYTDQLLAALGDRADDLDGDGCVGLLEAHVAAARALGGPSSVQHPQLVAGDLREVPLGDCIASPPTRAILGILAPRALAVEARGGTAAPIAPITGLDPGRWRVVATGPSALGDPQLRLSQRWLARAGDRETVDPWLEARRSRGWIGVTAGLSTTDPLPLASVGLAETWLPRAPGEWRFALGSRAEYGPEAPIRDSAGDCWSDLAASLRPGLTYAPRPGWGVGGHLVGGGVGHPSYATQDERGCATGPWTWGPVGGVGSDLQLTPGRAWLALTADFALIGADRGPATRETGGVAVGTALFRP